MTVINIFGCLLAGGVRPIPLLPRVLTMCTRGKAVGIRLTTNIKQYFNDFNFEQI